MQVLWRALFAGRATVLEGPLLALRAGNGDRAQVLWRT